MADANSTRRFVHGVEYRLTGRFAELFFSACRDINLSMTNKNFWTFAFGAFAMNRAQDLLDMMGKTKEEGGKSPYKIRFLIEGETVEGITGPSTSSISRSASSLSTSTRINAENKVRGPPANATVHSCSEPAYFCACVDCKSNCAPPEPWPLSYAECQISDGLKCVAFGAVLAYVLVLGFVAVTVKLFRGALSRLARGRSAQRIILDVNAMDPVNAESNISGSGNAEGNISGNAETNDVDAVMDLDAQTPFLSSPRPSPIPLSKPFPLHRYWLNSWLQERFYRLGWLVGTHPMRTLALAVAVLALCAASFSWNKFEIETKPEKLWWVTELIEEFIVC